MNALEVVNLNCGYDNKIVLKNVSFTIKTGEFVGIVGANGSGKTTLLRAISNLIPIKSGQISVSAKEMLSFNRKELASLVAFVPQLMEPVQGFTVMDTVLLGRTPYLGRFEFETEEDFHVAQWAIEELQITDLSDKDVSELSGGEFQRVAIARALAQEPKILLLDEATSHLDIAHQQMIARILVELNRQGRTIVLLSHDLNLAALYCSRILLLDKGRAAACDVPERVVTAELIRSVYGLEPIVTRHPETGRPQVMLPVATGSRG